MRRIILYAVMIISFESYCQSTLSNVEVDYDDVFERKGLVYYKSDNSLVTGKVIQYNKKSVAQRYIIVEKGKTDDLGWRIISDKVEQPEESALGTSIVIAAAVAGLASAASGNDINLPINNSRRNNISSGYIKYQKEETSKAYNDLSERNDISENLAEIAYKSNDSLAVYDEKELISLNKNSIDEKKNGTWEEFFDTGVLMSKGNYNKGLRDGVWEDYYENGQMKTLSNYKKGIKDGLWKQYYSNNQLWAHGYYQNGKMIGEWKYFDEEGNILLTENYGD